MKDTLLPLWYLVPSILTLTKHPQSPGRHTNLLGPNYRLRDQATKIVADAGRLEL